MKQFILKQLHKYTIKKMVHAIFATERATGVCQGMMLFLFETVSAIVKLVSAHFTERVVNIRATKPANSVSLVART